MKEAIKKVLSKQDLAADEMTAVFDAIMTGTAEKDDVKAFLLALKEKGETPDEIAAAAKVMRDKCTKVKVDTEGLMDTCGTGGAPFHDINVSTLVALVIAGCGVKVAKHGNRSFTGKCGSADILEALGIKIDPSPERIAACINKTGVGFMFAPNFHPAMKNVMAIRKELATRTIFNILGPLSNPAGARIQLLGVYKPEFTEVMAEALNRLGSEKAYVVHGHEGLDEISIKGETRLSQLKAGKVSTSTVTPSDFGLQEAPLDEVKGGECKHNAAVAMGILKGKNGAARDMVLMNASAALALASKAGDFKDGVRIAAECIDSGRALETLDAFVKESRK